MSTGLHSRNIALCIHCCRINTVIADKWPNDWHNRISHGGPKLFPGSAGCILTFVKNLSWERQKA